MNKPANQHVTPIKHVTSDEHITPVKSITPSIDFQCKNSSKLNPSSQRSTVKPFLRVDYLLALFLLVGCHSIRKAISRERAKATSRLKQVSTRVDSSNIETVIRDKTIDLGELVRSGEQFTGTVMEKYDTSGRLTERTTRFRRSRTQERAEHGKAQAKRTEQELATGQAAQRVQTKATRGEQEGFEKQVKRKGSGFWFELFAALGLASGVALVFWKRRGILTWLKALIGI